MTSPERPPHLIHFRISHYNEKVRWALDHKGWAHTREARVPGFHIPRVRALTGQNKVPVLVLDGRPLSGSATILREIEARRPEPALYPADPALRARAAGLEAFYDDEVAPALRRLFWSIYLERREDSVRLATDGASAATRVAWSLAFPAMRVAFQRNMGIDDASVAQAQERLVSYVDKIEAEVGPSGYLVGDAFGVADLAVAAVMSAVLRPPEFPYPLPQPTPPAFEELRASIAERPGARWVYETYRRHRGRSAELGA